ncbi:MAG: hypothetical protein AWM53_00188 [Candidatus Dichloromethanomonas elyunquensis]|nr:MAG: hypothetical protein AWM53_00188 [Candidatus Dichloromethanomonas elyunquensis]
MSNEQTFYNEILDYLILQLNSNFQAMGKKYLITGATGELKKGIDKLIKDKSIFPSLFLTVFADAVAPLDLDIFIVIMNAKGLFEILICEIKDLKAVGLKELSQLIGYCLISDSKLGLLINVDGQISPRLTTILHNNPDITNITRIVGVHQGKAKEELDLHEHNLGVMKWNSITKRIEYSNAGKISSIPKLCELISNYLE